MKNIFLFFILASPFVITSFSSCKHTQDVKCDTVSLMVDVTDSFSYGFNDSVTVTVYKQDGAFDMALDSARWPVKFIIADTFEVLPPEEEGNGLQHMPTGLIVAGYDYKLFFPTSGKTYLITNIVSDGKTNQVFTYYNHPDEPFRCYTGIVSCLVNGASYTATSANSGSYVSVIHIQ